MILNKSSRCPANSCQRSWRIIMYLDVPLADMCSANRLGNALSARNWTRSMYRIIAVLLLCYSAIGSPVQKTAVDLMLEGRFSEAKTLLADNAASARYLALFDAMTEPNAIKA